MAFPIPKIEYLNGSTTGTTTNNDGTISAVADLSKVQVGMDVAGVGIPAGAKVGSIGVNSFTLAGGVLATATGSGVTLTLKHVIDFDYPPIETKGPKVSAAESISTSISGKRQVSVNHIEEKRTLELSFLSPSIFSLVNNFMRNHALYGRPFRYFDDKLSGSYIDFELAVLDFDPDKIASRSATEFVWRVPVQMRRAL